jgi:t-SNARE complex subunit (syntaxin)
MSDDDENDEHDNDENDEHDDYKHDNDEYENTTNDYTKQESIIEPQITLSTHMDMGLAMSKINEHNSDIEKLEKTVNEIGTLFTELQQVVDSQMSLNY